jgi:hypothetical protein
MATNPLPILALGVGAYFLLKKKEPTAAPAPGPGQPTPGAPSGGTGGSTGGGTKENEEVTPTWPPAGFTVLNSSASFWDHCLDAVKGTDNNTVNVVEVGRDYAVTFKGLSMQPVKSLFEPTPASPLGAFFGNLTKEEVGDELRITFRPLREGYAQIDIVEGIQSPSTDFNQYCMKLRTTGVDPY